MSEWPPIRPGAFPPNPGHAHRERPTGNERPGELSAPFSPWEPAAAPALRLHGPYALDKLRTLDPATFPDKMPHYVNGRIAGLAADVARYHASIERVAGAAPDLAEERAGHLLNSLAAAGHPLTSTQLPL